MSRGRHICLALLVLLGLSLGAFARQFVGTDDGETWTVPASLPGGLRFQVRVAPVLRAASSPWGRRLLDHTVWHTRTGVVSFSDQDNKLVMTCTECNLRLPEFSTVPVRLALLSITMQRDGNRIGGWISATDSNIEQRVFFDGELSDTALTVDWKLPRSELSGLFGLFRAAIPEVRDATIRGHLSAIGTLRLPEKKWSAVPYLEGFEVHGLGTERLRHGTFKLICRDPRGMPEQRLAGDGTSGWIPLNRMGRWLPRAVLATEDAHFFSHAGYDLAELLPLLANAERSGRRGASTITQQLAKNFYVGGDGVGARKLRELLYAVEMERTLGKRRILTLYLNTVDWGPGLCGAADAGRTYFGRAPARLSPVETAWLGGILRNPHRAYRNEFRTRRVEPERLGWVMAQLPDSFSRDRKVKWIPESIQ
ncbi:MAG: biosynthetic peptidoglycan transglycosylase [Sulfuritalea sp.]|nr:biosynthetic peptidoglycan transglycosylase [Sulfuritalea sp.]MDP1981716.1 biosynthetic peptidoglycan transglycosylase [Sulfuritalea sp.]